MSDAYESCRLEVQTARRLAGPHPSLDLVRGAERSDFVDVAPHGCHDVLHKGGRALPQQQEAAMLAALQPRTPEHQTFIDYVYVMEQPAGAHGGLACDVFQSYGKKHRCPTHELATPCCSPAE
jgi:hypothetical protein